MGHFCHNTAQAGERIGMIPLALLQNPPKCLLGAQIVFILFDPPTRDSFAACKEMPNHRCHLVMHPFIVKHFRLLLMIKAYIINKFTTG
jgi:hypothetical protein